MSPPSDELQIWIIDGREGALTDEHFRIENSHSVSLIESLEVKWDDYYGTEAVICKQARLKLVHEA